MFGHRYFGSRYYGPRYWGDGGSAPPPPVVVTSTQGAGPGFNLFGQPHQAAKQRDRSREEIEDEIRAALDRGAEAETKRERREAMREVKEIVADIAAPPPPEMVALVREMESVAQFATGAVAYLDAMRTLLAQEHAQLVADERDDAEAILLMMEML